MVREAGLEPAWPLQPGDFKSPEYTYFSTLANLLLILVERVGFFTNITFLVSSNHPDDLWNLRPMFYVTNSGEAYWNRTSVGKSA